MSLEQIYFIAEIAASVAVVISLLYLSNQIKRSRIQAENDALDAITNSRADVIRMLFENPELAVIIPKAFASKERLTPKEYYRFGCYLFTAFVAQETAFLKWKKGDISNEVWNESGYISGERPYIEFQNELQDALKNCSIDDDYRLPGTE